jgi:tetratricopeptide (TPR) repeat protein
LGLAAVLGLVGGGSAWWYHTTRPDYRLRRGQEALRRGELDKAERLVHLLEDGGYLDHAHFLRGALFLHQRRLAEAVSELNQIREENEAVRLEAAVHFGLGFLSLGRPREAEHLLRYVVSRQPDHLDAHRGLAALYFDQGAKGPAVYHTREWVRLAPNDGYAHRFLGVIYSDFGDSNGWAIDRFREALRCGLRDDIAEEVQEELAELLVKQTDYAEALNVLDSLSPERAETQKALELRGECLWNLSRVPELRALLDRALPEHPRSAGLLRLQGQLLLDADNPKAATVALERAVQVDRHDHVGRHLLAQAYESLGRRSEAANQRRLALETQKLLEEVSDLSTKAIDKPWDAALRLRLAEVCEKVDRFPEAAMWRKAAAACPPADKTVLSSQQQSGTLTVPR